MNLGKLHSGSALGGGWPRQVGAMGVAVAVGVLGLAGIDRAEGRAEAVAVVDRRPAGTDVPPTLELPVPPAILATPEDSTTTTTTTTPPPPVETTTTVPPPAAPVPPATAPPPPPRAPASSGPRAQAQVEAIADSTGWDWRAAGVRFRTDFHPDCCHWGTYEASTSIIWVGPTAFADADRLRYVVLHELAHAWQYRQDRFADFIRDYGAWGFGSIGPALEAGADCVASVWGASHSHYWACPAEARALAFRRLGGDWR